MKILKIFFFLVLINTVFGQGNEDGVNLVDFSPKSKAYNIYYPKDYLLNEKEGIVTFTNRKSGLNITVSNYDFERNIQEREIIDLLNTTINDKKKSDWRSFKSKFDNLIEGYVEKGNESWMWWGISSKKRTVFISINKSGKINDEEIKLMRFIIERLQIN